MAFLASIKVSSTEGSSGRDGLSMGTGEILVIHALRV